MSSPTSRTIAQKLKVLEAINIYKEQQKSIQPSSFNVLRAWLNNRQFGAPKYSQTKMWLYPILWSEMTDRNVGCTPSAAGHGWTEMWVALHLQLGFYPLLPALRGIISFLL